MRSILEIGKDIERTKEKISALSEDPADAEAYQFQKDKKLPKLEKELELAKEAQESEKAEKEKVQKEKQERKPKGAVKISKDNLEECRERIQQHGFKISKVVERSKSEGPKVEKKVSTKLADNFVRTISGAVSPELTQEKVEKIKVEDLKDAKKHMVSALKSLRKALGGIDDDNSEMITRFTKNFDEIIDSIEEVKKKANEAA